MVEFSTALMSKLDGINRHSFNSFRLRVGEARGKRTGPGLWVGLCGPLLLTTPPLCPVYVAICYEKFQKSLSDLPTPASGLSVLSLHTIYEVIFESCNRTISLQRRESPNP